MNGFRKMQERLTAEGWFVAWNMPCCQTCAWSELSWLENPPEDMSKVLFNHSQDCEIEHSEEECPVCDGEGVVEGATGELDVDCLECRGTGYADFGHHRWDRGLSLSEDENYDKSVDGFACNYPEQQDSSMFCFDGSEEGCKNLQDVIPLIEECGCTVNWNGSGDSRIEISWSL